MAKISATTKDVMEEIREFAATRVEERRAESPSFRKERDLDRRESQLVSKDFKSSGLFFNTGVRTSLL